MIIENINVSKLHTELNNAEIFPYPVFDHGNSAEMTFPEDTNMELVQQIIANHDPTPVPPEPTEIDILGQSLVEKDLQIMDLQETTNMLGQQIVEKDIEILNLNSMIDDLGYQNVAKELQLMDMQVTNDLLGQSLVGLELRLLQLENGGI